MVKKKRRVHKTLAGKRREAHFAAGGTPAMLRGRSAHVDESSSKARKNKQACRGRYRDEDS